MKKMKTRYQTFDQYISNKASGIAGAIWDDRERTGTLKEQLETAASWQNMGTDGDLTPKDRQRLLDLSELV